MAGGVKVGVLGPLEVSVDGRPVSVPGRSARIVVAALAVAVPGSLSTDALAEAVWGTGLPSNPRASLQTVVSRLRASLDGAPLVQSVVGGYALRIAPCDVDVHRFRELLAKVPDDDAAALAAMDEALGLWRGEPLADVGSPHLVAEYVPRLTEEWFLAVERRADILLRTGRHGQLTAELRELCGRHPLREPL